MIPWLHKDDLSSSVGISLHPNITEFYAKFNTYLYKILTSFIHLRIILRRSNLT